MTRTQRIRNELIPILFLYLVEDICIKEGNLFAERTMVSIRTNDKIKLTDQWKLLEERNLEHF